jgi:hypothetical protein
LLTVDTQGGLHIVTEAADLATSHLTLRIWSAGNENVMLLQELGFVCIQAIRV